MPSSPGTTFEIAALRLQVMAIVRMETGCAVRTAYEASMAGLQQAGNLWVSDYDRWTMVWGARAIDWVKMQGGDLLLGPLPYQNAWWHDWDLARGLETEQREEKRRADDLAAAQKDVT